MTISFAREGTPNPPMNHQWTPIRGLPGDTYARVKCVKCGLVNIVASGRFPMPAKSGCKGKKNDRKN
jgi:hypothetical protein